MAGTCCNFATQLKYIFGYDDTLDVRAYFFLSFFRFCSLHTFLDTRHFLDTALAGA
jgi:hypothetical protein